HELLFEDRAGAELVALRSNRTMQLSAAEDSTVSAERNLRISAGADRTDEVFGDASTKIVGDELRTTDGDRRTFVGGAEAIHVKGGREVEIGGDAIHRVKGIAVQIVTSSRTTVVGADPHDPGSDQLSISGRYGVASVQEMSFASERRVDISCGKSRIVL